jgi:hypothetical protein
VSAGVRVCRYAGVHVRVYVLYTSTSARVCGFAHAREVCDRVQCACARGPDVRVHMPVCQCAGARPGVRVCGYAGVRVCGCAAGCAGVRAGCACVRVCGCACVRVCGCAGVRVCGYVVCGVRAGVWVCGCAGVQVCRCAGVCVRVPGVPGCTSTNSNYYASNAIQLDKENNSIYNSE